MKGQRFPEEDLNEGERFRVEPSLLLGHNQRRKFRRHFSGSGSGVSWRGKIGV